ncbi:MAG: hypothetical protein D6800_02730 [Candidatus Zixiibacteriota bacterium]|nr:MAG: hypothetical protein D6800_02730 [candidate division Zixibacteria bacterium]
MLDWRELPVKSFALVKVLVIAVAGLWAGFAGYRQYEAAQLRQPYRFNHAAHRPMACVICHSGARQSMRATLPAISVCLNCHADSPLTDAKSKAAWQAAVQQGGFRWKKLTAVPDYVFFSHQRHTRFGRIPCERCHGDIAHFVAPPSLPLIRVSMSTCVDCHQDRQQTEDCARCHK